MNNKTNLKTLAEGFLQNTNTEAQNASLFETLGNDARLWASLIRDIEETDEHMPVSIQERCYDFIVEGKQKKTATPHMQRWNRILWAACGMLVLGLTATLVLYFQEQPTLTKPMMVKTEAGNKTNITLSDGTAVDINALSELRFEMDKETGERIANLEGEGYFEVTKDEEHPFKVITAGMVVECLGTKFDVRNYEDDNTALVTLREGSVRVKTNTSEIVMAPGSRVIYDKNTGTLSQIEVPKNQSNAWTHGILYCSNENLENIANELARTYKVNIIISNPRLRTETFTGYLSTNSLTGALDVLSQAAALRFEYVNDTTINLTN